MDAQWARAYNVGYGLQCGLWLTMWAMAYNVD